MGKSGGERGGLADGVLLLGLGRVTGSGRTTRLGTPADDDFLAAESHCDESCQMNLVVLDRDTPWGQALISANLSIDTRAGNGVFQFGHQDNF
jgi:hypothetical protein